MLSSVLLTTEFLSVHLLLLLQTKLCLIVYHCIGVTVIIGKKYVRFPNQLPNSSVCVLDWKYQTKYFQSSKANDLELRV